MTTSSDCSGQFSAELRRLYLAAGRPPYRSLTMLAERQKPPVRLGVSTLSDWLNGRSVPSDPRSLRFLLEALQFHAKNNSLSTPGATPYRPRPWPEWERLRQEAIKARQAAMAAPADPLSSAAASAAPPDPDSAVDAPVVTSPAAAPAPAPAAGALRGARDWVFHHPVATVSGVVAVVAVVAAAVTATVISMASTTTRGTPGGTSAGASGNGPAPLVHRQPIIFDYRHRSAVVARPANLNQFWVARDVAGLAACPTGYACFYEHRDFNRRHGWMAFAQVPDQTYDFIPPYDKAIESVANKMTVDLALYPESGGDGSWIGVHAGETDPDLAPYSHAISSQRIFTNDHSAKDASLRLHQPPPS